MAEEITLAAINAPATGFRSGPSNGYRAYHPSLLGYSARRRNTAIFSLPYDTGIILLFER